MKKITLILSILFSTFTFAQQEVAVNANEINTIAKYSNTEGMELRWFPNSRALYEMGKRNGYVVERANFISKTKGYGSFKKIKEIKPYSKRKWDEIIRKNPNKENNLRELARDFSQNSFDDKAEKLVFKHGAYALKNIKHKQDNQFSFLTFMTFQDKEIALSLGLGTVDNSAVKGHKYSYRVVINTFNKTQLQNIVCRSTAVTAIQKSAPVNKSIGVIEGDKKLTIVWKDTPELFGYYVERSEQRNGGNYTPLNKMPLIFLKGKKYKDTSSGAYSDERLTNGKTYFYKIYANTLFGDKLLVGEVIGTPKDLTAPKTPNLENPIHNKDKVELKWNFIGAASSDLKGFDVFRSDKHDGEFIKLNTTLLSKSKRTFEDFDYSKEHSNYYKVIAYDTHENSSTSMPVYALIIDDTPPAKPKGIVASISKDGVVQIVIPKQDDDDIIGYKVFKANQEDHEFSVVEEVFPSETEPLFKKGDKKVFTEKIPLKTLTPNIFYKVKMYDRNFNQSEFSDVIKIVKPDVVPPASAVIQNVIINPKEVKLTLIKPSSKDLKEVNLYRKKEKGTWKLINKSSNKEIKETFIDKEIEPHTNYYYRIQAVDKNNLRSKFSPTVAVATINFEKIEPVKKVSVSKQGKQIKVSWRYGSNKQNLYFVIYRKVNDTVLKQIGHSSKNTFIDKRPRKGKNSYACRVMDVNGNSSTISSLETINN